MTTQQLEYRDYLASDHWRKLRAAKLREARHLCEKCRSSKLLQVHHLHYRHPWTLCVLSDLQVLCRFCHKLAHGLIDLPKPKIPKKVKHPKMAPQIAGSVGNKLWNSLGQRVDRNGKVIEFGKKYFKRLRKFQKRQERKRQKNESYLRRHGNFMVSLNGRTIYNPL